MTKRFIRRNYFAVALSVVLSFAFVLTMANAGSTISTNISTGGTLAVVAPQPLMTVVAILISVLRATTLTRSSSLMPSSTKSALGPRRLGDRCQSRPMARLWMPVTQSLSSVIRVLVLRSSPCRGIGGSLVLPPQLPGVSFLWKRYKVRSVPAPRSL